MKFKVYPWQGSLSLCFPREVDRLEEKHRDLKIAERQAELEKKIAELEKKQKREPEPRSQPQDRAPPIPRVGNEDVKLVLGAHEDVDIRGVWINRVGGGYAWIFENTGPSKYMFFEANSFGETGGFGEASVDGKVVNIKGGNVLNVILGGGITCKLSVRGKQMHGRCTGVGEVVFVR